MTSTSDLELRVEDRVPPQNIDAEENILGGILMDPEAITRVVEKLRPDAFYVASHQEIYRAALTLHAQGRPTDILSMVAWLEDNKLIERVGGRSYLRRLTDAAINTINIDQYARLVMDKYTLRMLIRAGQEVASLGYETSIEIPKLLDMAEQTMFAVTQERVQRSLVPASEVLMTIFEQLETRYQDGNNIFGVPTDFYDLDNYTQGLQPSDLIIVAGRPGMGKTAFALTIAQKIAQKAGLPSVVFSLEMSKEQLVQRLLCAEAGVESHRLRSARISEHEWQRIGQAIGELAMIPLYIDDSPNATVTEIRSKARRLQAEQGGKLGLVMIDYLQLMEGAGSDNRVQELSKITRGLKGLARELRVPVMALSQLSRGVEARTNKRPMLSDLRESGSIEQDADLVLMLYRDDYYNPDSPDRNVAEVNIVKHRNGPTGTVKLLFESQFTKFLNLTSGSR